MTYGEKQLQETVIELNTTLSKMAKYEHVLRIAEKFNTSTYKAVGCGEQYNTVSHPDIGLYGTGETVWESMESFANKVHGGKLG